MPSLQNKALPISFLRTVKPAGVPSWAALADGTLLPLFKFRSMNGGIVFKNAGPLVWLGDRQERTIDVEHVAGKINPADIFTKEMGNGAHFHRLRDSFMS